MINACGYQGENERQWKNRVNRNTNISTIKRVNSTLKVVLRLSSSKQRQGNVQIKEMCCTCKVVFFCQLEKKKCAARAKLFFFFLAN